MATQKLRHPALYVTGAGICLMLQLVLWYLVKPLVGDPELNLAVRLLFAALAIPLITCWLRGQDAIFARRLLLRPDSRPNTGRADQSAIDSARINTSPE